MKVVDTLRSVMHFRRLELDPVARRLATAASVADLRRIAERRLPRGVFDYIDGGAEDERTLRNNTDAFARIEFRPRVLRSVGLDRHDDDAARQAAAVPARARADRVHAHRRPAGRARRRPGRRARRRCRTRCRRWRRARSRRSPASATAGSGSRSTPGATAASSKDMVERCRASGYEALVMTVDTAVLGRRERDVRRGFELPPKLGLGTLLDGAVHPGWTWAFARAEPIVFANVATGRSAARGPGDGSDAVTLATYVNAQFDPDLSWDDVDWFRSVWDGPIVLKGIQCVADAVLAAERGVDAIALSNHGGRQLDSAPGADRARRARRRRGRRPHRGDLRRRRAPRQRHRQGRRARRTGLHGRARPTSTASARRASAASTTCCRCCTPTCAARWRSSAPPTIGDLHRRPRRPGARRDGAGRLSR